MGSLATTPITLPPIENHLSFLKPNSTEYAFNDTKINVKIKSENDQFKKKLDFLRSLKLKPTYEVYKTDNDTTFCKICNITPNDPNMHKLKHEQQLSYYCKVCWESFKEKQNLHKHIKAHKSSLLKMVYYYKNRRFSCHICKVPLHSKKKLYCHSAVECAKLKENRIQRNKIKQNLKLSKVVNKHSKQSFNKRFSGNVLNSSASNKLKILRKNLKQKKIKKIKPLSKFKPNCTDVYCINCKVTFRSFTSFRMHIIRSGCKSSPLDLKKLKRNLAQQVNELKLDSLNRELFSCPVCNRCFKYRKPFQGHLLGNCDYVDLMEEKSSSCHKCKKIFKYKKNLQNHISKNECREYSNDRKRLKVGIKHLKDSPEYLKTKHLKDNTKQLKNSCKYLKSSPKQLKNNLKQIKGRYKQLDSTKKLKNGSKHQKSILKHLKDNTRHNELKDDSKQFKINVKQSLFLKESSKQLDDIKKLKGSFKEMMDGPKQVMVLLKQLEDCPEQHKDNFKYKQESQKQLNDYSKHPTDIPKYLNNSPKHSKVNSKQLKDNSNELKDNSKQFKTNVKQPISVKESFRELDDTKKIKGDFKKITDSPKQLMIFLKQIEDCPEHRKNNSKQLQESPKKLKDNYKNPKDIPKHPKDSQNHSNVSFRQLKDSPKPLGSNERKNILEQGNFIQYKSTNQLNKTIRKVRYNQKQSYSSPLQSFLMTNSKLHCPKCKIKLKSIKSFRTHFRSTECEITEEFFSQIEESHFKNLNAFNDCLLNDTTKCPNCKLKFRYLKSFYKHLQVCNPNSKCKKMKVDKENRQEVTEKICKGVFKIDGGSNESKKLNLNSNRQRIDFYSKSMKENVQSNFNESNFELIGKIKARKKGKPKKPEDVRKIVQDVKKFPPKKRRKYKKSRKRCPRCLKTCEDIDCLIKHINLSECKIIKTQNNFESWLEEDSVTVCNECNRIFKYKFAYNKHLKFHKLNKTQEEMGNLVCPDCLKSFKYERCFSLHVCVDEEQN